MSQNEIMYLCKVLADTYTENLKHLNIFCISLIYQNSHNNGCQDPQAKVIRGWTRTYTACIQTNGHKCFLYF